MYAIVQTGGKQYRVSEGDTVILEKLPVEPGEAVTFDQVLVVSNSEQLLVGNPYVEKASVSATVLEHGKGKKIVVFKFKAKKNYRRKQGHRQPYTKVAIQAISVG